MLKKMGILAFVLFLTMGFSLFVSGEVLFEDDFEEGDLGTRPPKWNNVAGYNLFIDEDPDDPTNRVLAEPGEPMGEGFPTPVGWEDQDFWTDYIWEFDWRLPVDVNTNAAHRYQGIQACYQIGRRGAGATYSMFINKGGLSELENANWISEIHKWYRMQITTVEDQHIVKGKERDDKTPFDALGPIIEIEDGTFETGTIALAGAGGHGTIYSDNIVVYDGTQPVDSAGKLSTTWGRLRARY